MTEAQLQAEEVPAAVHEALTAMPVRADEVLEVPLAAVRAWLLGDVPSTVSDSDAAGMVAPPAREPAHGRSAFAVRAGSSATTVERVEARSVRPGHLLVVPSSYGGCDEFGWDPDSRTPVLDVAELAGLRKRRASVLRLDRHVLAPLLAVLDADLDIEPALIALAAARERDSGLPRLLPTQADPADETAAALLQLAQVLQRVGTGDDGDPWRARWGDLWASVRNGRLEQAGLPNETLPPLRLVGRSGQAFAGDDESNDASSLAHRVRTLAAHGDEVAELAAAICQSLELPKLMAEAVVLAAQLHDLGKADRRFQVILHGGDMAAQARAVELLAKSGMPAGDRAARRVAARASGYPAGGRHEELSMVLVKARLDRLRGPLAELDEDLIVHLVASHHGHARPLLPPVTDPARPAVFEDEVAGRVPLPTLTLDWSHPDRFVALNARYGRWGLALLESVVRLSDIACSAGETLAEPS